MCVCVGGGGKRGAGVGGGGAEGMKAGNGVELLSSEKGSTPKGEQNLSIQSKPHFTCIGNQKWSCYITYGICLFCFLCT